MTEKFDKLNSKVNVLIVLVVISLFLNLIMLSSNESGVNNYDETGNSEVNENYDMSQFEEIEASDIASFPKNETNVVYIGRETCSYCVYMIPNLKEAQKDYNYTTKYIDIAKIIDYTTNPVTIIDNNAYTILKNLETVESEEGIMDKFGSTPMMLVIKNNKIIASQVGYSEYDKFAKVLEKGGLKK